MKVAVIKYNAGNICSVVNALRRVGVEPCVTDDPAAIRAAEDIHGSANWSLGTILQEKGNCHLYEKMGYHPSGTRKVINDRMTLVFYEK